MTSPRRMFPRPRLSLSLLAVLAAPVAHAGIPIDVIASSDVSLEGQLQTDASWYSNDLANLDGDSLDGSDADFELRRAEFVLKGKGPGNVEWVTGYDAKADKWLDANLLYKIGGSKTHTLKFGQFKQFNSLEELGSSKHSDFISKAAISNTWAIGRRLGVGYGIGDARWHVDASYFGDELTEGKAVGRGFSLRGTFAPINSTGRILHLGLSYANYAAQLAGADHTQRWRVRPQADLAGVRLIDTGTLSHADKVQTTGVEGFWVHGPLKLQGEYIRSTTTRDAGVADFSGSGGYLSALWNVTGETWKYKAGTAGTALPNHPASGMWQLGLRYDSIDLNDGSVDASGAIPLVNGVLGGKLDAWTFGANWYLRSNFKLALNHIKVSSSKYSSAAAANVDDDPSITEFRAQFYW